MSSKTAKTQKMNLGDALRGKRVLVTRARAQADELVRHLQALGAVPIVFPTIRIAPPTDNYAALDTMLRQLATFDWVVFTSVNGVKHVWERLATLGLQADIFASVRLAAIGPATAKALVAQGLRVDIMPDNYVAEALLDALPDPAGQRFFLPRADSARDALHTGLQAAGADVVEVHAYSTVPAVPSHETLTALEAGVDVLTFTSSSTVRNFVTQIGSELAQTLLSRGRVVTIGPITADTARELDMRVDVVATEYTIAGLLEAIITACQ